MQVQDIQQYTLTEEEVKEAIAEFVKKKANSTAKASVYFKLGYDKDYDGPGTGPQVLEGATVKFERSYGLSK